MKKTVAVVLSGCGFQDGAEIHESVLTLLHLSRAGISVQCFAPNISQARVVNHRTGETTTESRNVLVESARIARGTIRDVRELTAATFDALIIPGGFGAALNLCTFGSAGADCTVHEEVARVITEFHAAHKPIGAICIAPALLARVLGKHHVQLTIGTDAATATQIGQCGAQHIDTRVDDICIDRTNKIVSTPAYMLAQTIAQADSGIAKLVSAVCEMM